MILSAGGSRLKLDIALPVESAAGEASPVQALSDDEVLTDFEFRQLEKINLQRAMQKSGWKISGVDGAAELLGIKSSTLAYRLAQFGLKRPV